MRRILAALAVASCCAVLAPAARAATPFGFNDNSVLWGQLTPAADAALAAASGATVSRMHFDWRWSEPQPGQWDLDTTDRTYQADVALGIRPILVVTYAPSWALANGSATCDQYKQDCRYPPGANHLDAWRDAIRTIAQRYPKLAGIEIWNEPNLGMFWYGGPDPAYYARLVEEAHRALSDAGSPIPLLAGALSAANDKDEANGSGSTMSYRHFLAGMYDAGVKGDMDGLSIHPYPEDIDLWRFFKMLTEVRDLERVHGDDTPLWVTEIGVTTTGHDPNHDFDSGEQAVMLGKVVSELRSMPDVKTTIVHTLLEPVRYAATSAERGYGVVNADGTLRPAYCTLASMNDGGFVCPPSVPDATSDTDQARRWQSQDLAQNAVDAARAYRKSHGSFAGMTSAALHAIDPRISPTAGSGTQAPGASADPSRILVSVWGTGSTNLLLCSTSRADRAYCVVTNSTGAWTYGSSPTNANTAAGAILNGSVWWW
jgi:hypothetical protein